ncbi:helix-turn-helix transcriptional regulator [Streptococcus anginosus]|uniref:helix-turn-helix domain-containing protein n=1 Tax=Streptococcus anginosus TaxID=1328 RepID=UPI002EDA86FC
MNRLKELRKEKKLTQEDLAGKIGVSKITILRWENGERQIKQDKAQQLADYFRVSVGYLLGYKDDYLSSMIEKYEENMKKPADFGGYGLLALTRGTEVQDKVIEALRHATDYYGERALNRREAEKWDEEQWAEILENLKDYADNIIGRFLAGLMSLPDELKIPIVDFLTLEDKDKAAVSQIIISLADNPVIHKDYSSQQKTQKDN